MNLKNSPEEPKSETADSPKWFTQEPASHGGDQPLSELRQQGPLPPPELLARYRHLIPDAPERFLVMTERQVAHRQRMEKWLVIGGTVRSYIGQGFAFYNPSAVKNQRPSYGATSYSGLKRSSLLKIARAVIRMPTRVMAP